MVVRQRPSTTRITGAWNVLPAKPKPTRPTLSMTGIVHHALSAATSPCALVLNVATSVSPRTFSSARAGRSEEHTSELQSRVDLVCRLLLEKKKVKNRRKVIVHHECKTDSYITQFDGS